MYTYLSFCIGIDSDDSDMCGSPLIPLKNITLPPGFLLPDFKKSSTMSQNVDKFDLFAYDRRSIKDIWIDQAKSFLRNYGNNFASDK